MIRNAGKVIRLKMPKTTTRAKIAEVNAEERFCYEDIRKSTIF